MYAVHLRFHASFSVCLMMSFYTRHVSLSVSFGVKAVYLLVSVSARHASVSANFSVLAVHLIMSFSARLQVQKCCTESSGARVGAKYAWMKVKVYDTLGYAQ